MDIKTLLSNPRIRKLKPSSFMAYCVLMEKAGESKQISKFSIRGLAREWEEDNNLGLIKNKDTVKVVLTELEELKKIQLITTYITHRQNEINKFNTINNIDKSVSINGRNMTNFGLFRKYISNPL